MQFENYNQIKIKETPKKNIKLYHNFGTTPIITNIKVVGTKERFYAAFDEEWVHINFKKEIPVGTLLGIEWEVS